MVQAGQVCCSEPTGSKCAANGLNRADGLQVRGAGHVFCCKWAESPSGKCNRKGTGGGVENGERSEACRVDCGECRLEGSEDSGVESEEWRRKVGVSSPCVLRFV